jgi:hypothetical protein
MTDPERVARFRREPPVFVALTDTAPLRQPLGDRSEYFRER